MAIAMSLAVIGCMRKVHCAKVIITLKLKNKSLEGMSRGKHGSHLECCFELDDFDLFHQHSFHHESRRASFKVYEPAHRRISLNAKATGYPSSSRRT